jgi:hypothetical protein
MQKLYHNIGFHEKRQLFCRKSEKISEISDHNIDPWLGEWAMVYFGLSLEN